MRVQCSVNLLHLLTDRQQAFLDLEGSSQCELYHRRALQAKKHAQYQVIHNSLCSALPLFQPFATMVGILVENYEWPKIELGNEYIKKDSITHPSHLTH